MYVYYGVNVIFVLLGWKNLVQKESLSFYQLITTETGPVVGLSLVIKSDYSWAVSYRNHVVSVEHCAMLQKIPSLINLGKEILSCVCMISHIYVYYSE